MKKRIALCLLSFLFLSADLFAQIGVQAGLIGVPGEAFTTADGLDKAGGAMGFTFGMFYNYPVSEKITFQPALNFVNKKWKDDLDGIEITEVSINYLEIPLQVVYITGGDKGFFIGAGPSVMYGLSGKADITIGGSKTSFDYEFGSGEFEENPFTVAANIMAGYSFGSLNINLNFSQGLTNQPDSNRDQGNENHFALRVGFTFGR